MSSLICEDSLNRYAQILQASIPDLAGFALCTAAGEVIQSFNVAKDVKILPAIDQLNRQHPNWVFDQETEPQASPVGNRILHTTGLYDSHGEVMAALVVLASGSPKQKVVAPVVKSVAGCIEREIAIDNELNAMTIELTERYEELNLVYHTEDQVNYFQEGQEALRNLTQNCLDYLDVGLAALILKEKGVSIFFNHPDTPIQNREFLTSTLADRLYSWVKECTDTVVINDMSDPLAVSLLPGIPYKVLCCPVLDSGGDVSGILVTVNHYSKPNFSNSDRNLLRVMARKASKILVANYDALTGLINLNGYEYFLKAALANVQVTEIEKCVLYINIDQLHVINDTVGHAAGDAVIRGVAATIESEKREGDTLSRLGGDEFGVLLHDCSFADAVEFAERICQKVEDSTIDFEGGSYTATVSIGLAMMTPGSESVEQVMGIVEVACSVAKDQGRNRVEAYSSDDPVMMRRDEQMHLVAHIQSALAEDRFELYAQPIQALATGDRTPHIEVLLRIVDECGEIEEPCKFIPAAERYQLMPSIDRWVVARTFDMLSEFSQAALRSGIYAVNLSGQSLNDKSFLDFVRNEMENSNIPPECICFEITETAAVANLNKAAEFMSRLKDIGCLFSLDDFGAGMSSFGYLKSLPVDYLKIDGGIVKDIVTDETSAAMVAAINQVGHAMKLRTIAEFVENDAIKSRLRKIGVDYIQGYCVGKPEPLAGRLSELMNSRASMAS